jgi:iron complex transport system substrate-binding protein
MSLDPTCVEDVLRDILQVGKATGSEEAAEAYVASLRRRIESVKAKVALTGTRPRVACLEWVEPVLVAGHWVPEMVEMAGGEDCLGDKHTPSFRIEWQRVMDQDPDVIVVTPCGFDVSKGLKDIHMLTERDGWESLAAVKNGQVYVVDASAYFSRSGPRLVNGLEIMAEILHPEIFTGLVPQGGAARLYGQVF